MVCSFQTIPASFIALENLKPSRVPEVRPKTPCRLGPTFLLPASREWQALQRLKTFLPLATSAASAEAAPRTQTAARAAASVPIFFITRVSP